MIGARAQRGAGAGGARVFTFRLCVALRLRLDRLRRAHGARHRDHGGEGGLEVGAVGARDRRRIDHRRHVLAGAGAARLEREHRAARQRVDRVAEHDDAGALPDPSAPARSVVDLHDLAPPRHDGSQRADHHARLLDPLGGDRHHQATDLLAADRDHDGAGRAGHVQVLADLGRQAGLAQQHLLHAGGVERQRHRARQQRDRARQRAVERRQRDRRHQLRPRLDRGGKPQHRADRRARGRGGRTGGRRGGGRRGRGRGGRRAAATSRSPIPSRRPVRRPAR